VLKVNEIDGRVLLLRPEDNCLSACVSVPAGACLRISSDEITMLQPVALDRKIARFSLIAGTKVLRYGAVIRSTTRAGQVGEHVYTYNLTSDYLSTYTLNAGSNF
jgi:altronate dehydratase small subunit